MVDGFFVYLACFDLLGGRWLGGLFEIEMDIFLLM